MPSQAHATFTDNKADVDRLWEIHEEVAGGGVGKKHGVEVLNRAAMVFITACWEAYVEDVALEGFDSLLDNAVAATDIPEPVRRLVAGKVLGGPDKKLDVWSLADQGWRAELVAHREAVKSAWVDRLNTPKTGPVNKLFHELLGISQISDGWSWHGMGSQKASEKLDNYITIRGSIAHRLKYDESVVKSWGTNYIGHVQRLVESTDELVRAHVEGAAGASPW